GFGGALIVVGRFLSESINDWLLRTIGLTSCLYAVLDIKSDILDRAYLRSDARMLAELTYIPTVVWGVLWITIALVGALFFLYVSGGTSRSYRGGTSRSHRGEESAHRKL
ncbi:M50 family metallopeptidase, partial [Candidatus Poribacteria bacterium]|nr:M50 family metallopeptidase [Candidatus Poribacteria bacterium]